MQDKNTPQEHEEIPTVGEPTEFEYRVVRTASGRSYTVKRPILSDNDDWPKKHRFGNKKRGPGRPSKKEAAKRAQEEDSIYDIDINIEDEE